jgi:hypothetical protein
MTSIEIKQVTSLLFSVTKPYSFTFTTPYQQTITLFHLRKLLNKHCVSAPPSSDLNTNIKKIFLEFGMNSMTKRSFQICHYLTPHPKEYQRGGNANF